MTKRQKTTRSLLAALLGVTLLLATGWAVGDYLLASSPDKSLPHDKNRLAVQYVRIDKTDSFVRSREFTGNLKAARDSQLSFERSGRVVSIGVDEGHHVAAGEVLAYVDVDQVRANLSAVRAQLKQAQSVLAELEAGPRKETIAATRARLASFTAEAKRLERNLNRSEKLIARSAISEERLDESKYAWQAAVAQRDSVQRELDELLAGTRQERIDAQRAEVQRLEAQIDTLELDEADGKLIAPFSGQIAERFVDEGTVVAPGTPVLRLVEDKKLEAWIGIPSTMSRNLNVGAQYTAIVDDIELSTTLESLRPDVDPITRTRNAVFKIHEPSQGLTAGQIVRLSIEEHLNADGFLVPTTSLVPAPRGLWNVYVIGQENRIERRNVELLYSRGNESLVTGTLRTGDAVVTTGIHRIVDGQLVAGQQVHSRAAVAGGE